MTEKEQKPEQEQKDERPKPMYNKRISYKTNSNEHREVQIVRYKGEFEGKPFDSTKIVIPSLRVQSFGQERPLAIKLDKDVTESIRECLSMEA